MDLEIQNSAEALSLPSIPEAPREWPFHPVFLCRVEFVFDLLSVLWLKTNNINYIGDLIHKTWPEIDALPNGDAEFLVKVKKVVGGLNLDFGMKVPGWPLSIPENYASAVFLWRHSVIGDVKNYQKRIKLLAASYAKQKSDDDPEEYYQKLLERLGESGFESVRDLTDDLNRRVEDAGLDTRYYIAERVVESVLRRGRTVFKAYLFEQDFKGGDYLENLLHARITETVNRRRQKKGMSTLTASQLFQAKRGRPVGKYKTAQMQVNAHFLEVMFRPEHSGILSMNCAGWRLGIKETVLIRNLFTVESAYVNGKTPRPSSWLRHMAETFSCHAHDLVPVSVWRMAKEATLIIASKAQLRSGVRIASSVPEVEAAAAVSPESLQPPSGDIGIIFENVALEMLRKLEQIRCENPRNYSLIVRIAREGRAAPNELDMRLLHLGSEEQAIARFRETAARLVSAAGLEKIENIADQDSVDVVLSSIAACNDIAEDDRLILDNLEGLNGMPKVASKQELRQELPHLEYVSDREIDAARDRALRPMAEKLAAVFKPELI